MRNSEKHPEAWKFYIKHARNMEGEEEEKIGKYRIPRPDRSGEFIYSECVEGLWRKFIEAWYTPDLNSECVRSKIQYIVNNF